MKCSRCGKNPMDHICEMGMCELKIIKEANINVNAHIGKEDSETCHIRFTGTLDAEFHEALEALMLEHKYTESL